MKISIMLQSYKSRTLTVNIKIRALIQIRPIRGKYIKFVKKSETGKFQLVIYFSPHFPLINDNLFKHSPWYSAALGTMGP